MVNIHQQTYNKFNIFIIFASTLIYLNKNSLKFKTVNHEN